jgi:hypothetical protein
MTQNQRERIHRIIQEAVAEAGGDWKRGFRAYVDIIEMTLTPPSASHTEPGHTTPL